MWQSYGAAQIAVDLRFLPVCTPGKFAGILLKAMQKVNTLLIDTAVADNPVQ